MDDSTTQELIANRQKAEKVVEGMPNGPLKVKAFEVILQSLLAQDAAPSGAKRRKTRSPARRAKQPDGTPAAPSPRRERKPPGVHRNLEELIAEGALNDWRSLSELQADLKVRGFHYKQEQLSPALLALTRARTLRREPRTVNKRTTFVYRKV